jgi:peptidyl-tRNA hydrolase
VLSRFSEEEFKVMPELLKKANEAVMAFCSVGLAMAMNQFN